MSDFHQDFMVEMIGNGMILRRFRVKHKRFTPLRRSTCLLLGHRSSDDFALRCHQVAS